MSEKVYNKYNKPHKDKTNPKGFWDKNGKYRSGKWKRGRNRKKCGAKLRNKDRTCQSWAMENGRCRLHGGLSVSPGAPKGSKNRMTHGEYETIWHDVLEDDEKVYVAELKLDVESQLNEELKLITVRERRMMQRIQNLKDKFFVTVDKTVEEEEGFGKGGAITLKRKSKRQVSSLKQIQEIEEALTRVQEKKARLLDLKLKVAQTQGNDSEAITSLVSILEKSRKRLSKQQSDEGESDE